MTDREDEPWVAPAGAAPLPTAVLPPTMPIAPPPAYGWAPQAPQAAGWPPPAPRRKRRWVVPVVVASSVVVLAGIVGIVVGATNLLTSPTGLHSSAQTAHDAQDAQPLMEGEAGSPIAAEPLECDSPCFTTESLAFVPAYAGDFDPLVLTDIDVPVGAYEPVPTSELYHRDADDWDVRGTTPDNCFFFPSSAPYA